MRTAGVFLALAVALALQTTLAGLTISAGMAVNLVLVAVVYIALAHGPVTGVLAGCAGGLIQDALAGAVVGVGGMAKTVVGFGVGVLGTQFIVAQPVPRFVMFAGATIVHEFCYQALYALVESRGVRVQYSAMLTQAMVNAVVGLLAFAIVESLPGLMQRRESRRGTFTSRRF
jgi:rod shape-determining protein MreD